MPTYEVEVGGKTYEVEMPEQKKSFLKKAAEIAYTPIRGTRGIGVTAEKLMEGVSPSMFLTNPLKAAEQVPSNIPSALEAGSRAVQPGYVPRPGERLGSFMGEAGGLAGVTAPIAALGGASALGQSLAQGGISAGISALSQASERGDISPTETAMAGALGGIPPLAIGAARYAFPKVASFFTKRPAEAFEKYMAGQLPKKVTEETIEKKAMGAFNEYQNALGKESDKLNALKKIHGLEVKTATPMAADQASQELAKLKPHLEGSIKETQVSSLVDEAGKPIKITVQREPMSDSEKLQKLWNIDRSINARYGAHPQEDAYLVKQEIDGLMRSIPGGEELQNSRAKMAELFDVAKGMGKNLLNKRRTAAQFKKIMKEDIKPSDIKKEISAQYQEQLNAIDDLEKISGKEIAKPLRDELLAQSISSAAGGGHIFGLKGWLAMRHPDILAAEIAMSSPSLMKKLGSILNVSKKAIEKAPSAVPSAVATLLQERGE